MWRRNLDSPLFLLQVLIQAAAQRVRKLLHGATPPTSPKRRRQPSIPPLSVP
jgi:hypothetical protein